MTFGEGRYTLTFNGEIYNFRELREQLGDVNLDSTGDTAVLGTLLARDGLDEVLPRLRGMFAFAWYDAREGNVSLARDRFGIKPLYWSLGEEGELHYGSELRAVRHLCGRNRLCLEAMAGYLRWGAVQAPHTMWEGIHCLPPGHLIEWREGKYTTKSWHAPRWPGSEAWISDPVEQQVRVREAVRESVRAHMIADVPVGVFLSGGLDSTLLASCMRQVAQKELKAFSIGYEENAGVPDETDAAEKTARYYGLQFFRERLSAESLAIKLDDYFRAMDQPTGDGLNTWLVSQVASKEVKVAISGLGADEWWGGYNYHRLAALSAASPLNFAGGAARFLDGFLPQSLKGHKAWKSAFYALGGAGSGPLQWQAQGRTIYPPAQVTLLLERHAASASHDPSDSLKQDAPDSWLHQLLLLETRTYLPNTLLRDNDWTSMAHSLELRVPLVDPVIFETAGLIPPDAKLDFHGGKRILRNAFRQDLPAWISDDTAKKTFTLPLMKWMRLPSWRRRIESTLEDGYCIKQGLWDRAVMRRILSDYFESRVDTKAVWALSQKVWLLFVLEEWIRNQDP